MRNNTRHQTTDMFNTTVQLPYLMLPQDFDYRTTARDPQIKRTHQNSQDTCSQIPGTSLYQKNPAGRQLVTNKCKIIKITKVNLPCGWTDDGRTVGWTDRMDGPEGLSKGWVKEHRAKIDSQRQIWFCTVCELGDSSVAKRAPMQPGNEYTPGKHMSDKLVCCPFC